MQELFIQPWTLLLNEKERDKWLKGISLKSMTGALCEDIPDEYPCLAKYSLTLSGDKIRALYVTESDAICFLKKIHGVRREEADTAEDRPIPASQTDWNRQVTALVMALLHVVVSNELITKEQFEILDVRYQNMVDEKATEYGDAGKNSNTAQFLRDIIGLD